VFFAGYGDDFRCRNVGSWRNSVLTILREYKLFLESPGSSVSELFEGFTRPCAVAARQPSVAVRARTNLRRVSDHQCGFTPGTPGGVSP
jgi:hypothetical protein